MAGTSRRRNHRSAEGSCCEQITRHPAGQGLQKSGARLVGEFDEQSRAAGLSAREIDAHVAATLIELLCLMVEERGTYSADDLLGVLREELSEDAA